MNSLPLGMQIVKTRLEGVPDGNFELGEVVESESGIMNHGDAE